MRIYTRTELTMRKIRLLLILIALGSCCFAPVAAFSQETPYLEIGVDYNYVHSNAPPTGCGCFSLQGVDGWIAHPVTRSIDGVAQLAIHHSSNVSGTGTGLTLTSYLFGPRYAWHGLRKFTPFGQALLGGSHAGGTFQSAYGLGSSNAFAMSMGAGLDVNVNPRFAVRAFEADYFLSHFANGVNDHQNNLRIGFGIVYRLNRK